MIDDQARNWTEDLPPPPSIRWLERSELSTKIGTKSLNIGHRYADHLAPSVKEHLQNWRDQICKLSGRIFAASEAAPGGRGFDPFVDLKLMSCPLPRSGGHRWAFECAGRTLGWLILQRPSGSDSCRLYLCNYVTVLSLDILTLGHSDKRDVEWMAGFFGEGVKVEINRLAQAGADVKYYTGPHQWTFFYKQQGPDRVLSVRQEPIRCRDRLPRDMSKATEPWHTLIVLDKLPSATLFKPDQFVFLHHPRQELLCDDGFRVLLDAQLAQKVYVQGIFVQGTKDPIPWAFDYRGHRAPPQLQMGRDRNQIDVSAFFQRLCSLYSAKNATINNADDRLSVFTDKLYDYLAYAPPQGGSNHRTEPRAPWRSFAAADHYAMSKALLGIFTRRHGPNAVPTDSKAQPSKENEADLLSVKLVQVQGLLLEWLQLSPECPTLESVWQRRAKDVLALPEFFAESEPRPPYPCPVIPLKGDMAALAVSLRDMVGTFFAPHIRRHQVRFKHFPSNLVTNRRLLKLDWEKVTYYILNDRLIAPNAVHIAQKKADSSFSCPGSACGCVRDCIVNDLLELLPHSDARAVERNMRRKLLALYDNNKIAPPAPDVLPPEEEEPTPRRRPAKRPREVPGHQQPPPDPKAPKPNDHHDDHADVVEREREPAGPRRGVADGAPDADFADLQHCMASTNATTTDAIHHPGRPETQVVFNHRCVIPEQSKLNIKRSSVGRIMGLRLWVEERDATSRGAIHPLQKTPPVITDELLRFAQTLILLGRDALALNLEHVNLVWEDSERVAFNFHSSLFFNLRYAEVWMAKSAAPLELLDYWFSVICHELAHNLHPNHGAEHTRVMGALVSAKMPTFYQLRQTIERSFNSWRAFDKQRPSN